MSQAALDEKWKSQLGFSGELNLELNAKTREHQVCTLVISIETGSFQGLTVRSSQIEAINAETLAQGSPRSL